MEDILQKIDYLNESVDEMVHIINTLELEKSIRHPMLIFDSELSFRQTIILEANLHRLAHINKLVIRGNINAILKDIQSLVNLPNIQSIEIQLPFDLSNEQYTGYPIDLSLIKCDIHELSIGGLDGLTHIECLSNIDRFTDLKRLSLYCCRLGIVPKPVYKMDSLVDVSFMLCQLIYVGDVRGMKCLQNMNLMYNPL